MKKFILSILAATFFALPLTLHAQIPSYTNTASGGVTLFTGANAAITNTSTAIRLPSFSGSGVLTVVGTGVTGSPSGCTITLAYETNNTQTAGAVVSTTSLTPGNSVQTFTILPSTAAGDSYVATYACSSTYPTAGSLSVTFSPVTVHSLDPCFNSPKSTASVAISTATTTSLVALAAGKAVYLCGFSASVGASTTLQFEYGTGAACVTTQTVLTGAITPATGVVISFNSDGTDLTAPAGNALCLVSTGTGGINGFITYVQQ